VSRRYRFPPFQLETKPNSEICVVSEMGSPCLSIAIPPSLGQARENVTNVILIVVIEFRTQGKV
jgi:hypothetical protein